MGTDADPLPDGPPRPADPAATVVRKNVVMADVARQAGVSLQTVSRVLNRSAPVSESTRRRVMQVVEETGFRPNLSARSLASRRSHILGVLVVGQAHYGMASTLLSVEEAARDAGLLVTISRAAPDDPTEVAKAMENLSAQNPECVVVLAQHGATVPVLLQHRGGLRVVLQLSGMSDLEGATTVSVDQDAAVRTLLEHLVGLGHRSVVHVAGPRTWTDSITRVATFERLCPMLGLRGTVLDADSWDAEDGYRVGRQIVAGTLPDAVLAANDYLALGVMAAFREAGVRVPHDVAVTGFDDVRGAGYFEPPLTTVRQDFSVIGHLAVACARELSDGSERRDVRVAPELVTRASTLGGGRR